MAENKTGIDDILESINKNNPDPVKQDPDPAKLDPDPLKQDPNIDPEDDDNSKNAAFAKMRVENKTLKMQVDGLQKQLEEVNKKLSDPNQSKIEKKEIKEEQTGLEERLAKIEEQLKMTSQELENERISKKRDLAIASLTNLRDTYNLKATDLVQFAEDAEARGLNLADNPERISDYYRLLYMDKIVAGEVEKALKSKGLNPGASSGPKGQLKTQGSGLSINEIIAQAEKLKK